VAERPRRRKRVEVEVIEPSRFRQRRPRIEREGDERVRVHWTPLERIVARVDLEDSRVLAQLRREMTRMGVIRMLETFGLVPGETLCIGGSELEWR
jgi:Obg family GTPase CgtA-like protein